MNRAGKPTAHRSLENRLQIEYKQRIEHEKQKNSRKQLDKPIEHGKDISQILAHPAPNIEKLKSELGQWTIGFKNMKIETIEDLCAISLKNATYFPTPPTCFYADPMCVKKDGL